MQPLFSERAYKHYLCVLYSSVLCPAKPTTTENMMTGKTETAIENAKQTRRTREEDAKDGPSAKEDAGRGDATTEPKNAGGKRTSMRSQLM